MTQQLEYIHDPVSKMGIVEWFRPGEYERVEKVIEKLEPLKVNYLRTGISWADWHTNDVTEWYEWLLGKLAEKFDVLPCFTYTPPSIAIEPKTSSPPKKAKDYADFIDVMITKFGKYFDWVELWNEPNNLNDWDWQMDSDWKVFCDMVGKAAYWAHKRGKKTALGGMSPIDVNWLNLLCERNVVKHIDAVGIHGFPGTWDSDWNGWDSYISKIRNLLADHKLQPEIWITEAGFSTWRFDEFRQINEFLNALEAPVERCYWYSAQDLHSDREHQEGFHKDEKHYHFGLLKEDGREKLLYRIWRKNGPEGLRNISKLNRTYWGGDLKIGKKGKKYSLVTGGAGFIGTNVADKLLSDGREVIIFDNLSRAGAEDNMNWLKRKHGKKVIFRIADTRNRYALRELMPYVDQVFHLAAQVAVTTSLENPMDDFNVNLQGTMNLLEEIRLSENRPSLLFTSTNKVYGNLMDVPLQENSSRYSPESIEMATKGTNEDRYLDFQSPYGCSKGAADQYVLDYCRMYNLPAVVFRMSCVYGFHQFGTEDQGWVAHFLIQALKRNKIRIYGDGKQVRDILFIDDLLHAMTKAMENIEEIKGTAFNIGGGAVNSISLIELIGLIENNLGQEVDVEFGPWRQGDQKYYVSDTSLFEEKTGWKARIDITEGVSRLYNWLKDKSENKIYQERREKAYV